MSFWKTLKELIFGVPLKQQFEEMVSEEVKPVEVVEEVKAAPEPVAKPAPEPVADQITDAVTQEAPAKPKRARNAKGKLVKDDPTTPDVNEAWEGGKAPAKAPKKRASKKK